MTVPATPTRRNPVLRFFTHTVAIPGPVMRVVFAIMAVGVIVGLVTSPLDTLKSLAIGGLIAVAAIFLTNKLRKPSTKPASTPMVVTEIEETPEGTTKRSYWNLPVWYLILVTYAVISTVLDWFGIHLLSSLF